MKGISLDEAYRHSAFARRTLKSLCPGGDDEALRELWLERLQELWSRAHMEARLEVSAAGDVPSALARRLREVRRDLLLYIIGANVTGRIGFEDVVSLMSDFAEVAINTVLRVHMAELVERFGVPTHSDGTPMDLQVVGMGKLGGRELNVSSDIDLIFLYAEDGETQAHASSRANCRTISNVEFFERLAKRIIPALNDIEGPGFVFRVDMRLRPHGEAGPIVASHGMLEAYLTSQGRDWERFAWIKGRVVNAPLYSSEAVFERDKKALGSLVRPFVFRKYMDFDAIASLTRLHEMIRAETSRRELKRKDGSINVKLGRGGIREIEFITQTEQTIRGGRFPSLRGRETLTMLEALAEKNVISEGLANALKADYVALRDIEHAIQYVNDEQTQRLARSGPECEAVAGLLGWDPEALWRGVTEIRERVAKAFDGVFQVGEALKTQEDNDEWPMGWESGSSSVCPLIDDLLVRAIGLSEPALVRSRMLRLVNERSSLNANRTERTRERLIGLIPRIVSSCSQWIPEALVGIVSPEDVLNRYLTLLEVIGGRSTYVALLDQYPSALAQVGRVLAQSRWCAEYVVQHPLVLDDIVTFSGEHFDNHTSADYSHWQERLHQEMLHYEGDTEHQMNILRDAHHSALFQCLLADLNDRLSVERLADHLSNLADHVIEEAIELAWSSLKDRHRERPRFAVIGYGKLGSKELGFDSDLDLVFIFEDSAPEADWIYSKLVRRLMSWLTLQTSSGRLFDVDLRLRPNGESGLVVTPFSMFCEYQRNQGGKGAWFWEHQALTRARFVAGDKELGARFEAERRAILTEPKDPEKAREEVLLMRSRMRDGHEQRDGWFDLKVGDGGMVDLEFCVQYLVLVYSATFPQLVNNFGNIHLLEMAAQLQLIDTNLALRAMRAYRRFRVVQHELRLNAPSHGAKWVPLESVALARQAVLDLRKAVLNE